MSRGRGQQKGKNHTKTSNSRNKNKQPNLMIREEEDIIQEEETEAEIIKFNVTHVASQAISHGTFWKMLQNREMYKWFKLKMNLKKMKHILKSRKPEKPY